MKIKRNEFHPSGRCPCCRCQGHDEYSGVCRYCNKGKRGPYAATAIILFAVLVIAWMFTRV